MHIVQQLAALIIGQVMAGKNLNQILSEALSHHPNLTQQERGALQDLCYGTLRFYGQLSAILQKLLSKPMQDMQIRHLLLVALYQLQFSKAASYAIVDHAVNASKLINPATGGLVNAVLRNFMRRQLELLKLANNTEEGHYSYQQWWITAVKKQYAAQAGAILEAGNRHPPMTLRVNLRYTTPTEYLQELNAAAIDAQLIESGAIILGKPVGVEKLPGFARGKVSIQDAGAQYAAGLLEVQDGMRVLDVCSAPGGKTAHLLEIANLELVAVDKDAQRLARVAENLHRLNLQASLIEGDAATPADWWDGKQFDRILADVPCSASGVVRRHPDIKWLRRPSDIESFAVQQQQILQAMWPLLAKGGKLLYATCSIFERENQQVVKEFLMRHTDAQQIILNQHDLVNGQVLPNTQHDGFYYALLQKNAQVNN